jgi:hypothetical protein
MTVIQKIYRHQSIGMTVYYIGAGEEEVRAGIDMFAKGWATPAATRIAGVSTNGP